MNDSKDKANILEIINKIGGFFKTNDTQGSSILNMRRIFIVLSILTLIAIGIVFMSLKSCSRQGESVPVSAVVETPIPTAEYRPISTAEPTHTYATEIETYQSEISDSDEELEEMEMESESELESESEDFLDSNEQSIATAINIMTGEPLDEAIAKRRPVAVVYNNLKVALPQSGIAQASLYYEVLAEGNITRIIALFQDFNAGKIGSIRSARHYFIDFAYDNDALFVHHGGSTEAYAIIRAGRIDNMDGQDLDGRHYSANSMFWRDDTRYNTAGMREHSSYTSAERILNQIEKYGYRKNKSDNFKGMFEFYETASSPQNGKKAETISIPYISGMTAQFKYDSEKKLYYRSQNGDRHIDGETGEQLSVSNIIVQKTVIYDMPNNDLHKREVELVSSGKGYLVTNGVYVPITWKKTSSLSPTQWFFEDGSPLTINVGKTWICVLSSNREPVFE